MSDNGGAFARGSLRLLSHQYFTYDAGAVERYFLVSMSYRDRDLCAILVARPPAIGGVDADSIAQTLTRGIIYGAATYNDASATTPTSCL